MRQTWNGESPESIDTNLNEVFTPGFGSNCSVTSRSGCDLFSPNEVIDDPFSLAYGNYNALSNDASLDMLSLNDVSPTDTADDGYLNNTVGLMTDGFPGPAESGWELSELPFYDQEHGTALTGGMSSQDQSQIGGDLRMTVVINEARQETLVEVMKVLVDAQARVEFRCG
ncbi:hypothetical protein MMC10_010541 [Thelotrema lepadinum]|nr:hypothetical protein [Thelotrema lepadinum]